METWMIILLWIVSVILFSIIGGEIRYRYLKKQDNKNEKQRKEYNKDSKIIYGSGAFRKSKDCRQPKEYLCVKCGDCGRKFVK